MGRCSSDGCAGRLGRVGELALDGAIAPVGGRAAGGDRAPRPTGLGLICPEASGGEAAWAGEVEILAAPTLLIALINHFKGLQVLPRPSRPSRGTTRRRPTSRDVKGQETRQARARDRGRRRPQSADGRAAGLGQVDAGAAPAGHPAAADAAPRSLEVA